MKQTDTICAVSTPPGVGGIAVVRLSGSRSQEIAQHLLRSLSGKPVRLTDHKACHAQLFDGDAFVDDVVALFFAAPRSFTGDDVVELSCHGSVYVQQRVLMVLCREGARLAEPGEFTMRAFMNGKLNLSQAEAVADLIDSRTEVAHQLAVSQLRGGYAAELEVLRQQFIDMAALLELELDFTEEDLEFASRQNIRDMVAGLRAKVQGLVDSFAMGNALKHGIPVAIIGAPNVGKSSLLNALLNDDRAIVSSVAGTTRDTIEETMTIGGILFRFIDTAGLHESSDDVEQQGIQRSLKAAEMAKVIILVVDASRPDKDAPLFSSDAKSHNNLLNDKIVVTVYNKSDLVNADIAGGLMVSAKEGRGIQELRSKVLREVESRLPEGDGVMLTNVRHLEAMHHVLEALGEVDKGLDAGVTPDLLTVDIRDALYHLGTITGKITSEEVLTSIFSRFCIGK
ncbi:MAG: tRNA uridine-5-carboxymethylaminomethyl(34) synthesis GTPase MnmE [Bacteroidales bacterium]|nr:tRNA uridine-5-carboxymethylaminomethyl(34) synthesis GTPase MnmE [Bacteroidales bacterium]